MILKDSDIISIGKDLIEELTKELIDQGHKDTSELIKSLKTVTFNNGFGIEMNVYGIFLNDGVESNKVRTPIDVLTKWVQRRITRDPKEARSIAFAIRTIQQREGMPTKASRRFARNGKRTGWIDDTLERFALILENRVSEKAEEQISLQIDTMTKGFQ